MKRCRSRAARANIFIQTRSYLSPKLIVKCLNSALWRGSQNKPCEVHVLTTWTAGAPREETGGRRRRGGEGERGAGGRRGRAVRVRSPSSCIKIYRQGTHTSDFRGPLDLLPSRTSYHKSLTHDGWQGSPQPDNPR